MDRFSPDTARYPDDLGCHAEFDGPGTNYTRLLPASRTSSWVGVEYRVVNRANVVGRANAVDTVYSVDKTYRDRFNMEDGVGRAEGASSRFDMIDASSRVGTTSRASSQGGFRQNSTSKGWTVSIGTLCNPSSSYYHHP